MKVKDLIKRLNTYNQDAVISLCDINGNDNYDILDIGVYMESDEKTSYVEIDFDSEHRSNQQNNC